jgi:hypothetical protein
MNRVRRVGLEIIWVCGAMAIVSVLVAAIVLVLKATWILLVTEWPG